MQNHFEQLKQVVQSFEHYGILSSEHIQNHLKFIVTFYRREHLTDICVYDKRTQDSLREQFDQYTKEMVK